MLWRQVVEQFLERKLGPPPERAEFVELTAAAARDLVLPWVHRLGRQYPGFAAVQPTDAEEGLIDRELLDAAQHGSAERLLRLPARLGSVLSRRAVDMLAHVSAEAAANSGWVTVPLPKALRPSELSELALLYMLAGPGRPDPRIAPAVPRSLH